MYEVEGCLLGSCYIVSKGVEKNFVFILQTAGNSRCN